VLDSSNNLDAVIDGFTIVGCDADPADLTEVVQILVRWHSHPLGDVFVEIADCVFGER
jgi:hypothetical protein